MSELAELHNMIRGNYLMEFAQPSTISKLRHLETGVLMPLVEQAQRLVHQVHNGTVGAPQAQAFVARVHAESQRIHRVANEPHPAEELTPAEEGEIRRIKARIEEQIRQLAQTANNITRQSQQH